MQTALQTAVGSRALPHSSSPPSILTHNPLGCPPKPDRTLADPSSGLGTSLQYPQHPIMYTLWPVICTPVSLIGYLHEE